MSLRKKSMRKRLVVNAVCHIKLKCLHRGAKTCGVRASSISLTDEKTNATGPIKLRARGTSGVLIYRNVTALGRLATNVGRARLESKYSMGNESVTGRAARSEKLSVKVTFNESESNVEQLELLRRRLGLQSKDQVARMASRVGIASILRTIQEGAL